MQRDYAAERKDVDCAVEETNKNYAAVERNDGYCAVEEPKKDYAAVERNDGYCAVEEPKKDYAAVERNDGYCAVEEPKKDYAAVERNDGYCAVEEPKKDYAVARDDGNCAVEETKKLKRKKEQYNVMVGKATVISEPLMDERKNMKGNLIEHIIENLLITWQCYCPFELNTRLCKYSDGCNMYGRCLHSAHSAKFMVNIIEIDENKFTFTCYSSTNGHPECQNNKREPVSIQNYRYEILNTEDFQDPPRSKTELIDFNDLTELWIEENNKPDGFLRHVGLPLSVVMYTKQQLKVVDKARTPIILHLDATGAYVRPIGGLKKKYIFYYALVYRASVSTIPLCEVITSEHDITSISTFLKQYKQFVISVEKIWPCFDAIVVDWSWASMHSILKEWNNTDISTYLNDTYLYLTKGTCMQPMTLLLSCCAHVMHRVSTTINKDFPKLKNNKGLVMELMALMIMSRNLEEMDILFEFIVTVFLEKDRSKCKQNIEKFLKERKSDSEDLKKMLENVADSQQNKTEMSWVEFARLFKKNPSIYAMSPFYRRYYLVVEDKKDQMNPKTAADVTNGLYCPEFLHYLLTTFMAYCPLWTAMMMDLIDPELSRITNVYAESHMKTYKHNVLKNKRRWKIGKVCRLLHENNENLVKENALSQCRTGTNLKDSHYDLYRKITEHSLDGLMWNREVVSDESKPRKVRKRKTTHMAGKKIIQLTNSLEEISLDDEKKDTTLENIPAKNKNKRRKKNAANDLSVENSEMQKLVVLKNGLVNDISYYAKTKSQNVVIAFYYPTTENFILKKEMKWTGRQLRNLLCRKGTIDTETIDIFSAMNADKCVNVSYLSTEVADIVLKTKKERNNQDYTININSCKTILVPYCEREHWMLLVVNETEKSLEILDPYNRTNIPAKILKALGAYMTKCLEDWTVKQPRNRPLQKLSDKFNSAIYIMYYAQCIGQKMQMEKKFDPLKYRETIIHFVMKHSFGLHDKCLYCFEDIDKKESKCTRCHRLIHKDCLLLEEMDTEDEEKLEFDPRPKRSKCSQYNAENFICRLCKR